jgi:para-nitrobenzyl esterase
MRDGGLAVRCLRLPDVARVSGVKLLLMAALPLAAGHAYSQDAPSQVDSVVITVATGELRCAVFPGHTDCLGIPYAAPPLGDLRLRAPAPPAFWKDVRDATRFAPACLQAKTAYVKEQQGSEDCLYLNVYVPADATLTAPLPVMVWLHGGGFINGSGNTFYGAYLAQTAKAVVVTVNYRLGPFGWLALPSLAAEAADRSSGNYGLRDTIAALGWVRQNIAKFGGDTKRVTIFGQSAGGEQVLALLASPYGAGLFQRAISMSAPAALGFPTVQNSAVKRAEFLKQLGCTEAATQPACLRHAGAQQMLDAADESWNLIKAGGLGWTPTVDGAVLPDQWLTLFKKGQFNKVPVMVGHTKVEGRLFVAIYDNDQAGPMTDTQVTNAMHKFYGPVAWLIRWQYPQSEFATPGDRLAQGITDSQFAAGENNDRDALSGEVPVYGYQSCDPNAPESHIHARYSKIGCGHDSDLAYLFQWDDFSGRKPDFNTEQRALALQIGHYWGNFAASGDPNGAGLPSWPKTKAGDIRIQLLEPESSGGVRTGAPGMYETEHKLTFWGWLVWLAARVGK